MTKKSPSIAKISRPTLFKVFPREQLFKLLEEGQVRSLIWISGPAGSGKTTLVASYIEVRKIPCLWYQIDEGDSDIATFFYYLGLAGKKAAPRIRRPLPLLTPEYGLGIQTFAKRYFEDLFERLKPPAVLILDNYQESPADSALHDIIANSLAVMPPGRQIIVISRRDPPASYARLQANNQMLTIGWEQLRLTPEELSEVMALQCAGPFPKETVSAVYEKTRGWAAGAVLLCQAVRMQAADSDGIKNLEPEKVFDYFSNELFIRADASVQEFLLKTASVPNLTPKLAVELSGLENAGRVLAELNRRNFFIEKRSQPEVSYQYHPLFREFLQNRAKRTFSPDTIASIQQNAAQMLETSGQVDDAAELYRESKDWQGMVRLILQNAQGMMMQGRSETLERWILVLPAGISKAAPWLLYWQGICRLARDQLEARRHLTEAYDMFKQLRDRTGLFLSWSGVVDTYMHEWDTLAPLNPWVRELKELLKQGESFPSQDIEIAVSVRMFNTLLHIRPCDRDLPTWQRKIAVFMEQSVDPNQRMLLSAYLVLSYTWNGELDKVYALIRDLNTRRLQRSVSPMTRMFWLSVTSVYYWHKSETAESLRLIEEALELSQKYGLYVMDARTLVQGVYASLTAGDTETARSYLNRQSATMTPRRMDVAQYHYASAYYFAVVGELDKSLEHAFKAFEEMDKLGMPFLTALGNTCLAQVYVVRGECRKAVAPTARARRIGRQIHNYPIGMQVNLLEAQMAHVQGNKKRMVRALRKGLAIGREKGLMGVVHWIPSVMESLCMKALECNIETEYIQELVRRRNFTPQMPAYYLENWPWPAKIYTFGRFSLLEQGRSLRSAGKAQKKPLDMLKAVIALGGREVSEQQITDALWPDAKGDAGHMLFKTTLYRLRLLVGNISAIAVHEGRLTLDNRLCWVDAWAFERFLGEANRLWEQAREGNVARPAAEAVRLTEKALALYKGPFLDKDSNEPWTVSPREHMRMQYIRAVGRLGCYWEQERKFEKAVDCYQSALRVDELTEEFYQHLMNDYWKLSRKAEAIRTYRRCCAVMKANVGVEPSAETMAIYRNIMQ